MDMVISSLKLDAIFLLMRFLCSVPDGLNLSSAQQHNGRPINLTIQRYVKDYVDEYVGECSIT